MDAVGPRGAAAEVADGGVAPGVNHPGGLLPQPRGHRSEGVPHPVVALHMPPAGLLAVVTPEPLQPLVMQGNDLPIGQHQVGSRGAPMATHDEVAQFGGEQRQLRRHAQQSRLGMQRAVDAPS